MIRTIIFSFIFLISITPLFAQYPTINSERPRVWIESSRFTTLQAQIAVPGEAQDTYNDVFYAYNNWWITDPQLYLAGSDSSLWTWDWSSPYAANQSLLTIFFYKMTNDPLALERCEFIAEQVIDLIDNIDFSNMDWYEEESLLRQLSDNDMLLDQCYNDFPVSLRDNLTQSLYYMNEEFMNKYILSNAGNSYVSSHNTWNNIYCNQNALTLYNAEGLTSQQKDKVNLWYQTIYDKHVDNFIPCWSYYRDDDGGWNWGAAYAMWSLVDQFQLFENMRIGTDKNFYTDLPWVQNSINQYVYFMRPDNKSIHIGDGQTSLAPDKVMFLHANIYNDPRSLWMSQYYSQSQFMTWTIPKFQKLLYKDFTMPTVTQPNLPLDWWTDKVGLSVSRSSWEEDATLVTFFNSPSKKAAHEHRDNNSFTIFKNSPLLIDAGYYDSFGSSHYRNYYERTIAHNSITVFDSSEGTPFSNDGGQIESFHLKNYNDIFLPENQRGKWIQFASGEGYSYNVADAQLSYNPAKLDFFRRRLLYIKPNKVIVLDHIHLKNIENNQRDIKWIAHFVNKPDINGNIINTTVPDHIETYDGNSYSATNENGNIAIKTLIPSNSEVKLIGGEDYEYWVDGTNYPTLDDPDLSFFAPGSWRIEVRPEIVTDSIIYLHTIDIGDSSNIAQASGDAMQSDYSVGADWENTLYFFAKDAEIEKTYHLFNDVQGNRVLEIFAADLIAGLYDIRVNGATIASVITDANGILQSSINLSSGNHTIEIVLDTVLTIDGEIKLDNLLIVFPNPSDLELNIFFPQSVSDFEIHVFDITGKLVIKNANKTTLNISSLQFGLYFIQVIQDNNYYTTKFIKQ